MLTELTVDVFRVKCAGRPPIVTGQVGMLEVVQCATFPKDVSFNLLGASVMNEITGKIQQGYRGQDLHILTLKSWLDNLYRDAEGYRLAMDAISERLYLGKAYRKIPGEVVENPNWFGVWILLELYRELYGHVPGVESESAG